MSGKILVGPSEVNQPFCVVTFALSQLDKSLQHGGSESKQGLQELKIIVGKWKSLIPNINHAVFRAKKHNKTKLQLKFKTMIKFVLECLALLWRMRIEPLLLFSP